MPVKIEKKCSRCRRAELVEVASATDAVKAEELEKSKELQANAIHNFLDKIQPELMPDVIVYVKGQGVIHTDLCDPANDAMRSCLKRVQALAKSFEQLEERKPRVKKSA